MGASHLIYTLSIAAHRGAAPSGPNPCGPRGATSKRSFRPAATVPERLHWFLFRYGQGNKIATIRRNARCLCRWGTKPTAFHRYGRKGPRRVAWANPGERPSFRGFFNQADEGVEFDRGMVADVADTAGGVPSPDWDGRGPLGNPAGGAHDALDNNVVKAGEVALYSTVV